MGDNINDANQKTEELFITYRGLVRHIVRQVLENNELADEATFLSWEKIMKNIANIGDILCPRTRAYIAIIAKNTAKDIYNKAKRKNVPTVYDADMDSIPDDIPSVESLMIRAETCTTISHIVDELSPNHRDVLVLTFYNNKSITEISEILGISYETAKKRLQRAKTVIKAKLVERGITHA